MGAGSEEPKGDYPLTEAEQEYPKNVGRGTGNRVGYTVEARYMYSEPIKIIDALYDQRWKKVYIKTKDNNGKEVPLVPMGRFDKEIEEHGLMGYSSAQAMRWLFHAIADASPGGSYCLETKIVEHELKTTYECNAISEHHIIAGYDRSNRIPDWGKK